MKTFSQIFLAAALAFAAASVPLQAHAVRRSPVVDAHMESTKGQWNRAGEVVPGPDGKVVVTAATNAPELDPASAASSIALLLAMLVLASQRRRDEGVSLAD